MSGADRQRRYVARQAAGRRCYVAEADEVNIEALLEGFHLDTVEELLELLTTIDVELVTRHGITLANVLLLVVNEMVPDEE